MIGPEEARRVVFGCGNFGGMGSSPALRDKGDDRERALALLDHARTLGLTRFDTANTYGGGVSEAVLGEWLRRQETTFLDRIEVATKVGNPNGAPPGERPLARTQIAEHLDRSLQRLGRERIDLYYLHEFDPSTPLEETLEALDRALAAGKIKAFGVSNARLTDLQAVLSLTEGTRLRPAFTHLQNQFNLLAQQDLAEVIPLAAAEGVGYVAFSPLAGGLLSGKYRAGRAAEAGTRLDAAPQFFQDFLTRDNLDAVETLARRAAAEGRTPAEAALRFILDTSGVEALVIAPRSLDQFAAYGLAGDGALA